MLLDRKKFFDVSAFQNDFICSACGGRLRKKKSGSSVSVTPLAEGEKCIRKIDVANKAHSQKMDYKTDISQCQSDTQTLPDEVIDIRELKQIDAAAVNRQISIQIQNDGCQGLTEFTWP